MQKSYTDEQVRDALAQLEINGGNLKRTARELQIPPPTLRYWRKQAIAAGTCTPLTPEKHEYDFAALWATQQEAVLERIGELLPTASFRDLSIFAGIAADKHLDYSQGRRNQSLSSLAINDAKEVKLLVVYADGAANS